MSFNLKLNMFTRCNLEDFYRLPAIIMVIDADQHENNDNGSIIFKQYSNKLNNIFLLEKNYNLVFNSNDYFIDQIMANKQAIGWAFLCLMGTTLMAPAVLTYPQEHRSSQTPTHYEPQHPVYQGNYPVYQSEQDARKFVEKPNASKKVVSSTGVVEDRNDLEDVQTNSISQDVAGGFSWSGVLGMIMQMLFNPASQAAGPSKSDVLDGDQAITPTSPWANLLSVGLKILTAFLGGGNVAGDGIDKVDNSSPMQVINIIKIKYKNYVYIYIYILYKTLNNGWFNLKKKKIFK
ncbi:hypothetical protein ACI65C_012574 [Semiaphis heraclei]